MVISPLTISPVKVNSGPKIAWFSGASSGSKKTVNANESPAAPPPDLRAPKTTRPATKEELIGLFEHLERELDACGFLHVAGKRPYMVRNLRNIFQRAGLTDQEVRTLRGVIAALTGGRKGSGG